MDYIKWSQEYIEEAHRLLLIIKKKKQKLKSATPDERHTINADIVKLRGIYYECMCTAKHLYERAGGMLNAA